MYVSSKYGRKIWDATVAPNQSKVLWPEGFHVKLNNILDLRTSEVLGDPNLGFREVILIEDILRHYKNFRFSS